MKLKAVASKLIPAAKMLRLGGQRIHTQRIQLTLINGTKHA